MQRSEFNTLSAKVEQLHTGLLGTPDFPGGKLGAITAELAAMPDRIIESIDKRRRDSRRSFIWDATKVFLGVAGAIIAAYVSYRGFHK